MTKEEFINHVIESLTSGKKCVKWFSPNLDYNKWSIIAMNILVEKHGFKKELFSLPVGGFTDISYDWFLTKQQLNKPSIMKNIHVLPTDKPSRLCFNDLSDTGELILSLEEVKTSNNQHIYITSGEELKNLRLHEGKWHLEKGEFLNKCPNYFTEISECKLVIMTTDQDLIADGVQAIDDEFLKWFVKNPSCESVTFITPQGESKLETITDGPTNEPEQLPTPWFKTEQIETWIGEPITAEGKEIWEIKGGRGKLIVMHQCGENKEELISQLETMIYGLKEGFEAFAAY